MNETLSDFFFVVILGLPVFLSLTLIGVRIQRCSDADQRGFGYFMMFITLYCGTRILGWGMSPNPIFDPDLYVEYFTSSKNSIAYLNPLNYLAFFGPLEPLIISPICFLLSFFVKTPLKATAKSWMKSGATSLVLMTIATLIWNNNSNNFFEQEKRKRSEVNRSLDKDRYGEYLLFR